MPSNSLRITISKRFLITYPDRSSKNVSRKERDKLLPDLKLIAPGQYFYDGPLRTVHTFPDMRYMVMPKEVTQPPSYLPCRLNYQYPVGALVREELEDDGTIKRWIADGTVVREVMETVAGMVRRLVAAGELQDAGLEQGRAA